MVFPKREYFFIMHMGLDYDVPFIGPKAVTKHASHLRNWLHKKAHTPISFCHSSNRPFPFQLRFQLHHLIFGQNNCNNFSLVAIFSTIFRAGGSHQNDAFIPNPIDQITHMNRLLSVQFQAIEAGLFQIHKS